MAQATKREHAGGSAPATPAGGSRTLQTSRVTFRPALSPRTRGKGGTGNVNGAWGPRPRRGAGAEPRASLFVAFILLTTLGFGFAAAPAAAKPKPRVIGEPLYAFAAPANEIPGLPNFAKVDEGLWRGAQPTAEGFHALARMGAKTVVSLRGFHSDRALLKGTGLRYRRIRFHTWHAEDDDVAEFLRLATDPAHRPVFVHCLHGADRTGTMVALYRMVVQGWPKERAIEELPRFGFHEVWKNLRDYLDKFDIESMRKRVAAVRHLETEVVQ